MNFRSGKGTQFSKTDITYKTFAVVVLFYGEIDFEKRYILV